MSSLNRRERIRRLTTPAGMAAAAERQRLRRGDALTHRYIVGGLRMEGAIIILYALEMDPATWAIVRPLRLTADSRRWYRWRTKQAANQFILRHNVADVHFYDLHFLDVLTAPVADGEAQRLTARPVPAWSRERIDPEA